MSDTPFLTFATNAVGTYQEALLHLPPYSVPEPGDRIWIRGAHLPAAAREEGDLGTPTTVVDVTDDVVILEAGPTVADTVIVPRDRLDITWAPRLD